MSERLLKPGWRRVKFGDVVRPSTERVPRPAAVGIERYVGLEHIEPGNLRIRSWGLVADGTTFTTRFRPGQVMFGKRRAYQRKLAVAEFEGVCSGDIYVLEPSNGELLPELLPFVCQSDAFFAHAVGTSAGSLSPRTKWESLASFAFALPPITEQQRIATTLSCASQLDDELLSLSQAARRLLDAMLLAVFDGVTHRKPLAEWCRSPITYGIVQAGPDLAEGVPYVRVSEMTGRDQLDPASMMRTSPEISASYQRTILETDDIVMALRGVPGFCHVVREGMVGANLSRGVARIAPNDTANPRFLLWALRSYHTQTAIRRYANGWKGEDLREITIGQLRSLPVPWAPRARQDAIAEQFDSLNAAWIDCRDRHARSRDVHARLREQALGACG